MGYNTGDTYEEKIFEICQEKGVTPPNSNRAGASATKADVEFIHLGVTYKLEVKNNRNPDYGQRRLHYDSNLQYWDWAINDAVSQFYDSLNVKKFIDPQFVPIWYQKRKKVGNIYKQINSSSIYTEVDLSLDQRGFESSSNPIPTQALFNYYKSRNTFYIQIEGSGFYHLDSDVANLGTSQYDGQITIRFRLKRHSTTPTHKCSFFAVLKEEKKPTRSLFNIEAVDGQTFPNIT